MKILKTAILISLLSVSYNSFADLNNGLVAYYCFDDATNIGKDCSTNSNNGSPQGNVTSVTGYKGMAAKFGGSNNPADIHVPNSSTLQFTSALSISYAMNLDSLYGMRGSETASSQAILAKSHDRSGFMIHTINYDNQTGIYPIFGNNIFTTPSANTGNVQFNTSIGKWIHVVFTLDAVNGIGKTYHNGILVKTENVTLDFNIANTQDLYIGKFSDYWYPFNGSIDEVRLYNRVITNTEVMSLYQQGTTHTITSITPTVAILNQQTTFTVKGTHLTDNMGFTIGDCDSNNQPVEIGIGTETQRQFQCTPRGTAGEKIGYIKTKPQGERLLSFTTKIQPSENIPIIIDVNPKTAELNKPTEFTITGGNLTTNMGFTIADCDASNNEIISKVTPLSRTFICTPRGTVGRKVGIIKTAPQELSLHYFDVQITAPKMPKVAQTKIGGLTNQSEVKTINLKYLSAVNDTTLTVNNRLKSQIALWKLPTIIKIGSVMRKVESYLPTTQGIILTVSIPTEEEWLSQLNFNGKTVLTSSSLPEEEKESNPTLKIKALRQSELNPQARKSIAITDNKNVFKFSFTNHVLYDVDGDTNTQFDQLLVNGDITIDKPTVTFNYSKSLIPLKMNASVKYLAGESFNLVYSSQELKFQFTNAKQPIKLATFAFPIPVTSGTVYGNLTLYLVYDINGKSQISATFNQEAKIDLGFSVNADSNKVIFDKWNKSSAKLVKPELTVTGKFNASLMINSALKFLVLNYDLTGINAGVGPSFNVKDKVTAGQSCLETRFNFNANASAYIMLPHIEVKETYWGWYSFETSMLKNTYSVFDGTIGTYEPFSLNGCTS